MSSALSPGKPHIAMLLHSMNEGGAQKRVVSLANGFVARGHSVDLVALDGAGSVGRLALREVRQLIVHSAEPGRSRRAAARVALKTYLERERPAVLLAGSNRVHIIAARACAKMADPPLLVLRAARHPLRNLPWSRPWKRLREYALRPIERWAMGRADLIIAVSQESAAAIAGLVANPAKVVTIPNPTITSRFRESLAARAQHDWLDEADAGGDPVILGVGRLSPQKDFETLVKAVCVVNRSMPVKLILLGEGKRRNEIERLVEKLGLSGRVHLMGHVDGVGGWLSRATLLVSSSLWEGSPGAIIEAFEAGTPVVATACPGGSVELLACSTGGVLVPMRDHDAMAESIIDVLAKGRDLAAIRALAQPYQDDGRAELHYLAVIEEALEEKRRRP
ncbi:MAG: glycosyltransferase [Pseudomonadota bacterium]|nr:glycosyltransferase [Pseudomonadota bacterium]